MEIDSSIDEHEFSLAIVMQGASQNLCLKLAVFELVDLITLLTLSVISSKRVLRPKITNIK